MKSKPHDQPNLFHMEHDARPATERSTADRYREPSLLDAIREAPPKGYDYDRLIAKAQAMAPDGVRVDMCRNDTVAETYWLFSENIQIGSVRRDRRIDDSGQLVRDWIAIRLSRGMPHAQRECIDLAYALLWASGPRAND